MGDDMKDLRSIAIGLVLLVLAFSTGASAAESGAAGAVSSHKQDAVCTKCHDESESKPILSIYQTPHGVSADGRTPSCQSCHGESSKHLAGATDSKTRPPPDIVFGSKHTTAGYSATDAAA